MALAVSRIKARRTATFPLGQFFYEALYSSVKGLMILGVILMAVVTSIVRSTLLKTDAKASFVDGVLSLGIAAGVLLLRQSDSGDVLSRV